MWDKFITDDEKKGARNFLIKVVLPFAVIVLLLIIFI